MNGVRGGLGILEDGDVVTVMKYDKPIGWDNVEHGEKSKCARCNNPIVLYKIKEKDKEFVSIHKCEVK